MIAGALLAAALVAPVAGQVTERVSVDSSGAQGNSHSSFPSISADGRYVAFGSYASNLVSGDTNGSLDVFVRDRQSGATELVSVDSGGAHGNADSYISSISADGRYVAFASEATNLVSGDTNGWWDVFVHDRLSGTTERVSVSSSGAQGDWHSDSPSISADGRYVAFASEATNLVSGDTNWGWDVFVHDRQSGATERVSVDSLGAQGDRDSGYGTSISADGRYVAFASEATNLVSVDTNWGWDVFVHDRQSGATERVSVDSGGAEGNGSSYYPSISSDGRYVAFHSFDDGLVSGDTNGVEDIFVRDRQSGSTERMSIDSGGAQGNAQSYWPSISADGRYVAFETDANNLVSGDTNAQRDVFVRDRCAAATSATFSGDGINADTIAPVNAVLGSLWSAPLTIGHPHGVGGPLSLRVRGATTNGPNFLSPMGGRLTEILVSGAFLGTILGSHDGVSGDVPPQTIPDQLSLVGTPWAAQYTVFGGGFGDLSQAVYGVVGCQ